MCVCVCVGVFFLKKHNKTLIRFQNLRPAINTACCYAMVLYSNLVSWLTIERLCVQFFAFIVFSLWCPISRYRPSCNFWSRCQQTPIFVGVDLPCYGKMVMSCSPGCCEARYRLFLLDIVQTLVSGTDINRFQPIPINVVVEFICSRMSCWMHR